MEMAASARLHHRYRLPCYACDCLRIGGNDLVNLKIIDGAFWLIALVAGAYLGIATLDDRNKAKEVLSGIADKIRPPGDP